MTSRTTSFVFPPSAKIRWYICPLELRVTGHLSPVPFSWLSGPGTRRTSFNLDDQWCLLRVVARAVAQNKLTNPLLADVVDARGNVRVPAGPSPITRFTLNQRVSGLSAPTRTLVRRFVAIRDDESARVLVDRLGTMAFRGFNRNKILRGNERELVEE